MEPQGGEAVMPSTFETSGPRCPHCQHLHRADEPLYFDEAMTEWECEACMVTFAMRVFTQTSWSCTPLPEEPK